MAEVKYKWPKTSGGLVDRAFKLRTERAELQKKVDALKKEETAIKDHLVKTISKSNLQGIKGKIAQLSYKHIERPTIEDIEKVIKWQASAKGTVIMQRRLNEATIREIWADGKQIPGIGVFDDITISLSKVS